MGDPVAAGFFFQAEDGIRDTSVTGVQTCALPISVLPEAVAVMVVIPDVPPRNTVLFVALVSPPVPESAVAMVRLESLLVSVTPVTVTLGIDTALVPPIDRKSVV